MRAEKRKAAPDAGTSEATEEAANLERCRAYASRSHCTTGGPRTQALILDYLPEGAAHALTANELARVMGTDRRSVSRMIQRARLTGAPICASCGYPRGYWIAETPEELRQFVGRLECRAGEMGSTISALERTADTWEEVGSWTQEK